MSSLILFHQLKVEGFIVLRWSFEEWSAAFKEMAQWIQEVCLHNESLEINVRISMKIYSFFFFFKGQIEV